MRKNPIASTFQSLKSTVAQRVALALMCASAAHCGKEEVHGTDTYAAMLGAACDVATRCAGVYTSAASCLDEAAQSCDPDLPPLETTVEGAARCARAMLAATCEDLSVLKGPLSECESPVDELERLMGRRGAGEGCYYSFDCAEGFYCDNAWGSCGVCVAEAAVGTSCERSRECQVDAYCQDGTCQPRVAIGQPCTQVLQCSGLSECIDGVCALPSLGEGQRCADSEDSCKPGLFCIDDSCQRVVGDGEVCAVGQCEPGYRCVEGQCEHVAACGLGEQGAPCEADANCQSGLACDWFEGSCQPVSAGESIGAHCESALDCHSGLCLDGECADPAVCTTRKVSHAQRRAPWASLPARLLSR